jgi:uncharacterized membrane protein
VAIRQTSLKRDTKIAAAVFLAIPVVILTAASMTTLAIAHGASMQWRLLFRLTCHGIPRRCLTIDGVPMPICARCTGIYLGLIAGLVTFAAAPWLRERWLRVAAWIAVLPMAIDGITQAFGLRESNNSLRLATGITAAFVFGLWALSGVEHREDQRFTAS